MPKGMVVQVRITGPMACGKTRLMKKIHDLLEKEAPPGTLCYGDTNNAAPYRSMDDEREFQFAAK